MYPLCTRCNQPGDFRKLPCGKFFSWCRLCETTFHTIKRNKLPIEKRRHYRLFSKFGLTLERFNAILAAQGNCCAACKSTEPGVRWKFWAVDHNRRCCAGNKSCG